MVYTKELKLVEVMREGGEEVLKINYEAMSYTPSIEDNPLVMMDAIDKLVENPSAARITFHQRRKYAYTYEQTQMLVEIANIYSYFFKSKRATSLQNIGLPTDPPELLGQRLSTIQFLLFNLLKQDPLAAYAELKRVLRTETINKKTTQDPNAQNSYALYTQILEEILSQLEKTKIVLQSKEYLAGYTQADREVYRLLFRPTISPDFMYAKLTTSPPLDAEQLDLYKINSSTDVAIYKTQTEIKNLYHINPPEFKISEDKFELIDLAKKVIAEHQPQAEEFLDPEKMRTTFTNISKDLIRELAEQRGMLLSPDEVVEMAEILVRHTIGFGVVELLLEDEKVQDLTINSPMGQVPIFLLHENHAECVTNIIPSTADFESWTTKFRLLSGRPLDEANPILDTEIILPKSRSRLSVIGKPLNPYGFGMSFRRHRDTPWTLPLFIKNGMMTPLSAGLLSFTIDGARAHLIAGTRSSGKCLKGDELVQLADGKLIPIKEIVEEHLEKGERKTCDDGYYSYTHNLKILTADEHLNISPKEVSCVWKRTSPKDLYEIKLRSGKKITTTAEHPVLAMDTTFFGYKKSAELKQGMRIGTARNLSIESAEQRTHKVDPVDYPLRTNAKRIRFPEIISKDLLEFIGYVLGDGHVFNGGIQFTNCNLILQGRFNYILEKEFGIKGKLQRDRRNQTPYTEVFSKNLTRYLNKVFQIPIGAKSGIIDLPNSILSLPKEDLSVLIKALYDCDGYIAKDHRELEYSTKSKKFAQQLQLILSRFGIISFTKQKEIKGEIYNSIFINGSSCNLFHQYISFTHPEKQRKLELLAKKDYLETTNIDSIPYGNFLLKEIRKKLRVSPSELREATGKDYWAYENNAYHVSAYWFRKLVPFYEQRYEERAQENVEQLYDLKHLLQARKQYIRSLKELTQLLDISQEDIKKQLGNSPRKSFALNDVYFLDTLYSFKELMPVIHEKGLKLLQPSQETIALFMKDVHLSYAEVARQTGLAESSIKYYSSHSLEQTNPRLVEYFLNFKVKRLRELQKKFIPLYHRVLMQSTIMNRVETKSCVKKLQELREKFHIQNEEYNASVMTVSNFFNEKFSQTNTETLYEVTRKSLEVYESATGKELRDLLVCAKKLCSEDIFWDEIVEIHKIESDQEWVYDLTVDTTHNFIANGTIVHNSSFLGALLLEIMRKYRVLTIEDSVSGDSEILIKEQGNIKKQRMAELVDSILEKNESWYNLTGHEVTGNIKNIEVLSMNQEGKISFSKVSKFIRHKVDKPMYFIKTATGREIEVTGDHSLFSLNEEGYIAEIKPSVMEEGSFIAVPRKIPNYNISKEKINILEYKEKFSELYFKGENLQDFVCKNQEYVKQIGKELGYKKTQILKWIRTGIIPGKLLYDLDSLGVSIKELKGLSWKKGKNAQWLPAEVVLDESFLTFLGLWLADGCYDKNSVLMSVGSKEEIALVKKVADLFDFSTHYHSDAFTLMIHSGTLKFLMREILDLKGDAYTKRIPSWIFETSKQQTASVLKGIFSGDGCITEKEIVISLCSKQLLKDIQTLLLYYGIIFRIGKYRESDKCYPCRVSNIKSFRGFRENIGVLQSYKTSLLEKLCNKQSTHDSSDIIPLSITFKKKVAQVSTNFNSWDYISRENHIGREKLFSINKELVSCVEISEQLEVLASSDLFWDKVKEIKRLPNKEKYVYDISVPENESFVCNNIVAHNTLELPVDAMRKLGYNIQPLKVRGALSKSGSEVPADEGIRTSLRLGDSALIVGEVRSSIRGTEEVFVVDKGKAERVAIKDLEGRELSEMYVPTMDRDLKFKLKKLLAFVKHPKREKLLEVTTKTGRKVTVTPDHSLFTQNEFRIIPIECKDLTVNSKIIIPEKIPCGFNDIQVLNSFEMLEQEAKIVHYDEDLRNMIQILGWKKASEYADVQSGDIYVYLRKGIQHTNIPIKKFQTLAKEANYSFNPEKFELKSGTGKTFPSKVLVTKELCRFLGYYVAEGYTNKTGEVVFSNGNAFIVEDMCNLSRKLFNIEPVVRTTISLGESTQMKLGNRLLGRFLAKLACGRVAGEKRVPSLIFGLSEEKICEFLKGYYDGDGCQVSSKTSGNTISCATISKGLANDLLYLLLTLGIVARVEEIEKRGIGKQKQYHVIFKQRKYVKIFLEKVAFKKYTKEIIDRQTSHSVFNTIDYDPKILEEHVKIKRKYRHLRKYQSCGKEYLKNMVNDAEWASERIKTFVNGDFYLDEIKEIKEVHLNEGEYVYDLSVEPCQNFLGGFGGIMLHNTEALALFEAMRIGASANVVAGTIHADSPYGVFDRIANDLKVPRTSFKATDIIIICNPIRSADGMKRVRRCLQITEVGKGWEEDPVLERGFTDLMRYNAKIDKLEPTPELMNGESEILKNIAANVKEWVGNWDAIWENIVLRGDLKQMLVDYSSRMKMPELLEAEFCLQGNDMFHRITESVQAEVGSGDVKRIKFDWEEWLKREIRKKQLG